LSFTRTSPALAGHFRLEDLQRSIHCLEFQEPARP